MHHMFTKKVLAGFSPLLLCAAITHAATPTPPPAPNPAPVNPAPVKPIPVSPAPVKPAPILNKGAPEAILPKLHALNVAELSVADLGRTKACRAEVVKFANHIFADHTDMDKDVAQLASERSITIDNVIFTKAEQKVIDEDKAMVAKLKAFKDKDCAFDKQFLQAAKNEHSFAIQVLTAAIYDRSKRDKRSAKEIAAFRLNLQLMLDMVKEHYQMAHDLLNDANNHFELE